MPAPAGPRGAFLLYFQRSLPRLVRTHTLVPSLLFFRPQGGSMKKLTIVLSVIVVFSCLVWAQAPPPAGQQPAPPDPAAGQQPVGQRPAAPQPAAPPPAGQQPAAPAGAPEPSQLQNWSGTLLDATCRQADAKGKCPVSGTTTAFGLSTSDGK